jgi:hypothetical protein
MPTDKYDLHTVDYSVQGWDAIMTTDMEKIDDMIPTRILGTLGETVTAYQALYLKAADSKWWKAQADGAKQPCLGLAIEGGSADDEIRIHRMGEITNAGWSWATIGAPIYLDASTAGAMTQTKPSANIQIVGYALSATKMLTLIMPDIPWEVDRGDPAAVDFTSFTTDATWRDLDCSSIVPAGARFIKLKATVLDDAASSTFRLRKKGNSNAINIAEIITQVANVGISADLEIPCDSSRTIQYWATSLTWTSINLTVKGWKL